MPTCACDLALEGDDSPLAIPLSARHVLQAIAIRAMTSSPNSAGAKFEAAIYAALSAAPDALPAILPACSGWEDALWARLLTEVGAHVADEQRKRNQGGPAKPMPIQVCANPTITQACTLK
eukprot:scaffold271110_cov31-Tisochrysis_lutea.AAC.2